MHGHSLSINFSFKGYEKLWQLSKFKKEYIYSLLQNKIILVKKSISGLTCQIIRYIIIQKILIYNKTRMKVTNIYVFDLFLFEVPYKWSCINVWRSEFKWLNWKRDAINALITDGAGNWFPVLDFCGHILLRAKPWEPLSRAIGQTSMITNNDIWLLPCH